MGSSSSGGGSSGVRLGNQLLRRGVITGEQLSEALVELARGATAGGSAATLEQILLARGWATPEQVADAAGAPAVDRLGRYELIREVGRGGMGVVYEARDLELGRTVALKLMMGRALLDPEDRKGEVDEERFVREARLVAALSRHPGIVSVHEAGVLEGRRFIAMEFVAGEPFTAWRATASLRRQVEVLRDVARAVHHAHAQGVIHRDLKPDNILVDAEGRPHVTDFGLAKAVGQDAAVSLTAEGMVVGTPAYMSPEQAQGLRSVDGRSDVWALGVLLYESLSGRKPFQGETAVEILLKAAQHAPAAPSSVAPKGSSVRVDPGLERICLNALARNPEERTPSAEAFAEDLTRWLEGKPVEAVVPSAAAPTRRSWPAILAIGAAAVALLALAGYLAGFAKVPGPQDPWANAARILPSVKPQEDAIAGTWRRQEEDLLCESSGLTVLSLPYEPPAEYDVRIVFTPQGDRPDLNVIGLAGGQLFQWYVGAQQSTWFGFGHIDGSHGFGHPSGSRVEGLLVPGRRHTALLEVRKGTLTGWLDGRRVSRLETEGRRLDVSTELLPRHRGRLALVTWFNPTAFHSVEVLERGAQGRLVRPR